MSMGVHRWISFSILMCSLVYDIDAKTLTCKPVIIIHGILDGRSEMEDLTSRMEQTFPGAPVHVINLFNYMESLRPLWQQVGAIHRDIKSIMNSADNGVNIIGFSQGGLVARGIIQTMDDHNVDTFIALSSPLNGQYGGTSYFRWVFPNIVKRNFFKILYTRYGQRWSIANYWRDPHHLDGYRMYSSFLAQLNNESVVEYNSFRNSWKTNFLRLKRLVLVGGPDDGVITPWQSSQFGAFDSDENVVPMRNLQIYENDSFGLKTLDNAGNIVECVIPGVEHTKWHGDATVFHKCIEPFLCDSK